MIYKKFTVIIPTLNEKRNIGILIDKLLHSYNGINVIVVDDGSEDGTVEIVKKLASSKKTVRLIDRHMEGLKAGLTASVIDGIIASKTSFVIVMDADLQHPYRLVGTLAKKLMQGNDLVVATRAQVKNWSLHRRIISRLLMYLGYFGLWVRGKERCSDIFSGFFAIERSRFINIYRKNEGRFVGPGFKVLFDLLKCIGFGTVKLEEVPYTFVNRRWDLSKVGVSQGVYLIWSFLS